jgi:hypothetical protein
MKKKKSLVFFFKVPDFNDINEKKSNFFKILIQKNVFFFKDFYLSTF